MQALEVQALSRDFSGCHFVEMPVPRPGPGEVLIRIEAAGLGFPDLLMTRGEYQVKPPLPFVPGMEAAGTVVALGDGVTGLREGQRVLSGAKTGGLAGYGVFPASATMALPDALSFPEAAALRAAYVTAWVALVRRGQAQAGEWLLVHGAAGGVGLAAVDLARHLGLCVIAVASNAEKRATIARLYAPEQVIDPGEGIREQVLEITGGQGVDLVYDPVGGDAFDQSVRCIAFNGRLLVIGFASGRIPALGANIALIKGFSMVGVRAGEYSRRFPDRGAEDSGTIVRLAAEGVIRPHVDRALPLSRWREAFDAMASRAVVGRTVLLPHG
ncbi:MAG: NADPH:quinone oxidoreductase family protein [Sphingomonadales bacterium]|nr:NADPH:quinone oxidoreductase family protein [Sphingomonadales bacterium]MDE2567332.1 NADPH:quinone oxidoreductase family protein [Sphingomonadales bacterium]